MEAVKFTRMKDGDREDYAFLRRHEIEYEAGTAERLLAALAGLDSSLSGYQLTRLAHSLQAATRAWRCGADVDWMVAALLHDVGDVFAPCNHAEYAAAIIRPYVREQCTWVVTTHGVFQMLYYAGHVGADPNAREAFRGNPYYDDCAEFCEQWDQNSFDPDYEAKPLEFFAPLVREVFARPAFDPAVIRPGVRVPLSGSARLSQT